ncbi:hypothetical protein TSOC_013161 [Tetrabaena socialis]|uniref:Uncharacterized protein n=1 Tax=Tetrabaena socialis TaxID=47790 RepID=A0A2J7ZL30_9CHLO|nr:hypothetical protein TSOC_013161 [Tetrabaena socialis]|eukprot:PNH00971.1 hypothetical protein TSOC_013161 [Tetrabaena socialis]
MEPRAATYSREGTGGSRDGKRTFKEKLHNLIAEAEQAEAQAYRESQLADRKTLCIQLLVEGRPQAFVDFFSLTHGRPDGGHGESTSGQEEVPQEALGQLRAELLRADNALRSGDTEAVYSAYKNLAKYFAQIGRLHKAEFFFRRCLRLSQDTQVRRAGAAPPGGEGSTGPRVTLGVRVFVRIVQIQGVCQAK